MHDDAMGGVWGSDIEDDPDDRLPCTGSDTSSHSSAVL